MACKDKDINFLDNSFLDFLDNQLLDVFRANKNLEICMLVLFEQLSESEQFRGTYLFVSYGSYFKNTKQPVRWKLSYMNI